MCMTYRPVLDAKLNYEALISFAKFLTDFNYITVFPDTLGTELP